MALNDRIRVVCRECWGERGHWNGPMTRKEGCKACSGTGRDAAAEARLAELAARLRASSRALRWDIEYAYVPSAARLRPDLDALLDLLAGPGEGAAGT